MELQTNKPDYQSLPRKNQLAKNLNYNIGRLCRKIGKEESWGYRYIITTIKYREGFLVQEGCGPNFQGGLVTLCTCKHKMRTYKDSSSWSGVWIAGFLSVEAVRGRQVLVFLMRVKQAFDSHYDLWFSELADETKLAKAANMHQLGDLYQPRSGDINKYNPQDYIPPHKDHVHVQDNDWHKDIDYHLYGRPSFLLVGDPELSFLWNTPMLYSLSSTQAQGEKKFELKALLTQLGEN